ncbi:hypothetical protein MQE22_13225 [Acidithiobacillus sp. YTS05]|nr:hypothetical protein MQE22_13225 [Acidithiobacillus sp. YTS05]
MGHNSFTKNQFALEYIPHRLAALELCVLACDSVLMKGPRPESFSINIGILEIQGQKSDPVLGALIDSGIMAIRSVLNFLGIKLNNGTLVNASYALTIESFDLPLVPLNKAISILSPKLEPDTLKNIWIEALITASKSTAHFTEGGGTIIVNRLAYAAYAASLLLRKHFFEATGTPKPDCLIPDLYIPDFSPEKILTNNGQHIQ